MRRILAPLAAVAAVIAAAALVGCGGKTVLIEQPVVGVQSQTKRAAQKLGFPTVATKNTTRVGGGDPTTDAAAVALAVYPSSAAGTHPQAVTLAPTDDWQAAIAASALMAAPLRAPILLSPTGTLPSATADALSALAPTGSTAAGGSQLIKVGDVPTPGGMRTSSIAGNDPFTLAAAIDRFASALRGRASADVVVASADQPGFAMPAAGWAAESGDAVLFVTASSVPAATRTALLSHPDAHIYVLGPPSVIGHGVIAQLARFGSVKRIAGTDDVTNAVNFAEYRNPACVTNRPCGHIPGSFGWAMRSPGHGYVLINSQRPLDAAAAAPLSGSGDYGPALLVDQASTLPTPVLNFFLNYGTPGYSQYGPTAAVYNHAWVIGDQNEVSVAVQGQLDSLLEVVPQSAAR